jgi:subtilisin family serine protease
MKNHHVSLSLLVVCGVGLALLPADAQQRTPPGLERAKFQRAAGRAVPNQYIVVLDERGGGPGASAAAAASEAFGILEDFRVAGRAPQHVYERAIRGFSITLSEDEAIALSKDPRVAYVEEDAVVEAVVTQSNATWGLDRIDQRDRPLSGTYSYTSTGSGVNAYIIDTGIRRSHTQFGGRALIGFDAVTSGGSANDCNGHGTHVAGTVGGSIHGVAKSVRLYAVRVLNCSGSGTISGVIAGVNWVTANRIRPAVANMSLGGGASSSLDTAVRNSIASGVTYSVAAGNSNVNASNSSPARVGEAITVGSSTSTDARSSFSNYGSIVDIFAPGSSITSAWHTSNTATRTISGTSMAAPHVAGVAARYLQGNTGASPSQVATAIINDATTNRLSGLPTGTPNRLLFRSGLQ